MTLHIVRLGNPTVINAGYSRDRIWPFAQHWFIDAWRWRFCLIRRTA